MFGSMPNGVRAYAKVGVETGVAAASPHKLIVMLFDGALAALATATYSMNNRQVAAKGQAISKAISIIDGGLRASLDKKAGGQIAENLDALYEYMSTRLLMANIENKPELLQEVQLLLQDLKQAWCAIDSTNPASQPEIPLPGPAQDPLAPKISRLMKA